MLSVFCLAKLRGYRVHMQFDITVFDDRASRWIQNLYSQWWLI